MIILKNIKIKNFISHSDTELSFNGDDKILIDGNSGSGKTSICESITWALYGEARVDNRNLVKRGATSAEVAVFLTDDTTNDNYKITRSVTTKGKQSLFLETKEGDNWIPANTNGLKDTQEFIENNILHASYTLFINSIAYPQDNVNNFLKQTASRRKDLLLEIANVKDFDVYYSRAKEELTLRKEKRVRFETLLMGYEERVRSLNNIVVDTKAKSKEVEEQKILIDTIENEINRAKQFISSFDQKQKDIDFLKKTISEITSDMERTDSVIKRCETDIKEMENDSVKIMEYQVKMEELKKIREEIAQYDIKRKEETERIYKMNALMADKPAFHDYDKDVSKLNQQLIPLVKDSGKCPSGDACPFVKPIMDQVTFLSSQIREKKEKKLEMEKSLAEYQAKIAPFCVKIISDEENLKYEELKASERKLEPFGALLTGLINRSQTKESLLDTVNENKNHYATLNARLMDTKAKIMDTKAKIDNMSSDTTEQSVDDMKRFVFSKEVELSKVKEKFLNLSMEITNSDKAKTEIFVLEKNIKEEKGSLSQIDNEIISLTSIKEAFGSKGLKTVVIDYLIPRLEDKINEILSQLSEFRVRLDTQKESVTGEGTVEGLYINIINDVGEELDYANYSGGEALKIRVAISEALASLQKIGFRMLDELFVGLDEESTEHFVTIMAKLNKRFKQMFCISHLRNIKDIFEEKIFISKVNGTSIVQK